MMYMFVNYLGAPRWCVLWRGVHAMLRTVSYEGTIPRCDDMQGCLQLFTGHAPECLT